MKSKITKIQKILMKGIAFFISAVMTVTPIVYATSSLDDSGSQTSFIEQLLYGKVGVTAKEIEKYFASGHTTLYISDEIQLRALAEYVNSGNSCSGKVIKLEDNIVVNSNEEWIPIGKEGATFKGTFDGMGHTISGINFNRNNKLYSEITNVGLFGCIENSTLKNIKLENSRFSIPYTLTPDLLGSSIDVRLEFDAETGLLYLRNQEYLNLGAITGQNINGTVNNCIIDNVEISGLSAVGGIVGFNNGGTVKNCKNDNSNVKGLSAIGGIVGNNTEGTIEYCTNNSFVDALKNAGGIVGESYGSKNGDSTQKEAVVNKCINNGITSAFIESVGGIAGKEVYYAKIEECINNGKVEITTNDIELQALKSNIIKTSDESIGVIDQQNIGGIVGWCSGSNAASGKGSVVNSCINKGTIKGVKDVGGLIGQFGGAGGGKAILVYSTNSGIVTPDPIDENGESGYVTGEVGADEATLYLYENKYGTTSLTTAGIVTGYNTEDIKSKEYGLVKNGCTIYFIANEEDTNYSAIPEKITVTESNIGYKSNTDATEIVIEDTVDSSSNTKVTYTIYKNNTIVNDETYLKEGDTLKVVAKFDKYLAKTYGPIAKIDDNVMSLKINNSKNMTLSSVAGSSGDFTTTITYTYTVQAGEKFEVNSLNLSKNGTVYILSGNDYETNHPTMGVVNKSTAISGIYVDAVAPIINTNIYVENKLETGRYTAGKEVLITMTTSEKVQDITEVPVIKVNFSESGEGKYNYQGTQAGAGYAKPIAGVINEDETVTITYSYQIQEGDEGDIAVAYTKGKIYDIAGNETNLTQFSQFIASDTVTTVNLNKTISGKNVATNATESKNISYKIYKGTGSSKEEIVGTTYISNTDVITVEAIIGGFVYSNYTNGTSGNSTAFLNTATAPDLKINNILATPTGVTRNVNPESSVQQNTYEGVKTTITYTISGSNFNYSEIKPLTSITLKPSTTLYISNRYAKSFATSGAGTDALYDIAQMNSVTTQVTSSNSSTVDISGLNIYIDPVGVANTFSGEEGIYADTTKPTVQILSLDSRFDFNNDGKIDNTDAELIQRYCAELTLDSSIENKILKNGDINGDGQITLVDATRLQNIIQLTGLTSVKYSDKILYTFTWSEEINGFNLDDITVNGGQKGNLSIATQINEETYTYSMYIIPNVENGNEGELQVIIEQDAVQDLVYQGNVRSESVITIDKKAPILQNYSVIKTNDKIIIEAIYDEAIASVSNNPLEIKFDGKDAYGNVSTEISGNKVTYTYTISGADDGKASIRIIDEVTDFSGNKTDALNVVVENDISLVKSSIIVDGNEYIFPDILDLSKGKYYKEGDIVRVKKGNVIYTYTVSGNYNNNTQMKYVKLTDPEIAGQNGTAEFSETRTNNEFIDITDAHIYFDTTLPKVTTRVEAVNPKAGIYTEGDELRIIATSSENVDVLDYSVPEANHITPKIKVKFGENDGKFASGLAQYVETIENANGTTSWVYRYVISEGDEGSISLSYDYGRLVDLAGNETNLSDLNNENNIFTIIDRSMIADTTRPTVSIIASDNIDATLRNITNSVTKDSLIRYDFIWSETITGFDESDITVNGGNIERFEYHHDGHSYHIMVNTNVQNGNTGELQVIVEQDAVQDAVGYGNIRTESVITIDRQAPILQSIESFGIEGKEYYKAGDTIQIVATFNENIENTNIIPVLSLNFSESGTAKNPVSEGIVEGNKITYNYVIKNQDNGILSIKEFSGIVKDVAGNETIVAKKNLEGNTLIADTIAPTLVSLTAIAPEFEYEEFMQRVIANPNPDVNAVVMTEGESEARYGVQSKTRNNNQITIIAEYSENIVGNAPTLELKFSDSESSRIISSGTIVGNKITYTYNISNGDNGYLTIQSLNGTVSDLAGNTCTTNNNLPETTQYLDIVADTTKPSYTIDIISENKDDNGNVITGNGAYYRKGSKITITATTNELIYKAINNNNIIELSHFTKDDAPELTVKFGNNPSIGGVQCADVEYSGNNTIFTYEYEIKENDNGALSVNIAQNVGYDIALNGNKSVNEEFSNIIADTVYPVTNWQSWVDSEEYGIEDNEDGTWTVTFSEIMYAYNPDIHRVGNVLSNSNKSSAPILLVSSDNVTPLETTVSNITTYNGKTVITYTYSPYTRNIGAYGMKFANVSDKAGNLFNYRDQVAPVLSSIRVTDPETGTYKAGQEITIVATFSEKVTGTAPTLAIVFGNGATRIINTGEIVDNTITYKYTIVNGDNGKLQIVSYTGEGLKDLSDNIWVAPENVTISGNIITADTTAPYITSIKAYKDYETNNKKEISKTNSDIVTYEITWSEPVFGFTEDGIGIINGQIVENSLKVKENTDNKVYTVDVDSIGEGVQLFKVYANSCEDIAGNLNEDRAIYRDVVIDYTKPEIRVKINGGDYVLDNENKSTLKEIFVVNEKLSQFEYSWSNKTDIEEVENWNELDVNDITVNSDIPVTTILETEDVYYLYMKATDDAGNTFRGRTNAFNVNDSKIIFASDTDLTNPTNKDIKVTVSYGEGLTQNRKAGIQGISQSADSSTVIITENGTVYAEACDIAGNKVHNILIVNNIDKVAPVIDIEVNTNKVKIISNDTDIKDIGYSTNENVENIIWKDYDPESAFGFQFLNDGTYYVWAKDNAGNISEPKVVVIDTTAPTAEISYVTNSDGSVTATITLSDGRVTNNDGKTTYTFTQNGEFTFEFEDEAGNSGTAKATVTSIVDPDPVTPETDTTAPEITFNYTTLNAIVGTPIGSTITTNEDAIISYSWNNINWNSSNEYTRSINVTRTPSTAGTCTLYAKATDRAGNVSGVSTLVFNVVANGEVIVNPEIEFNDVTVIQKDGVKYVKVSPTYTIEKLTSKMNVELLLGATPEYIKLTSNNKLRTGSEIRLNGETKYIVIVNGDINCDGKVDFINDIIMINNYRIGKISNLSEIQLLAGDINNSGTIDFIPDIVAMNNYRLGNIKDL